MNQKLEDLLKGFKPRFGNIEDINMIKRIGKLRRLQESVGKHEKRVQSLSRAVSKQTENQKRLARDESSMITQLEKLHGTA